MVGVNITCKYCRRRHPAESDCMEASERANALASAREDDIEHQRRLAEAALPVAMPLRTYIATRVAASMSFNYLGSGVHPAGIASHAVQIADALIKELNK